MKRILAAVLFVAFAAPALAEGYYDPFPSQPAQSEQSASAGANTILAKALERVEDQDGYFDPSA